MRFEFQHINSNTIVTDNKTLSVYQISEFGEIRVSDRQQNGHVESDSGSDDPLLLTGGLPVSSQSPANIDYVNWDSAPFVIGGAFEALAAHQSGTAPDRFVVKFDGKYNTHRITFDSASEVVEFAKAVAAARQVGLTKSRINRITGDTLAYVVGLAAIAFLCAGTYWFLK